MLLEKTMDEEVEVDYDFFESIRWICHCPSKQFRILRVIISYVQLDLAISLCYDEVQPLCP